MVKEALNIVKLYNYNIASYYKVKDLKMNFKCESARHRDGHQPRNYSILPGIVKCIHICSYMTN